MSDLKIYSTEELRKMSLTDRMKLMEGIIRASAELTLNIRTGKEKQNHFKDYGKSKLLASNFKQQSRKRSPLTLIYERTRRRRLQPRKNIVVKVETSRQHPKYKNASWCSEVPCSRRKNEHKVEIK